MSRYVKAATPGVTSIATTGNTDEYLMAPKTGKVVAAVFSSLATLAANDSNYVTFGIVNLGQAGAGTAAILGAVDGNTTKATGGTALAASTKRALTLSTTTADLSVVEGDVLRVRFAATGTLAGAVTRPIVEISIKTAQR
jgi:hypothetical protein